MNTKIVLCASLSLVMGCTSVFAQNANDVINLFGVIAQSAIAQKTQAEWRKLSQSELACVNQNLRQRGSDLGAVIQQGIVPSDARISDVRAACRSSTVQSNSPDDSLYYVANTRPPDAYLSLRSNPTSASGQRITTMPNGTVLRVLQRQDDGWWYVKVFPSGPEGWALSGNGNRKFIECCKTPVDVRASPQSNSVAESLSAQTEQLLWDHNGSTAYRVAQGRNRLFYYKEPRPGMISAGAKPDSLIFDGEIVGADRYKGTAYIYNSQCGQFSYQVSGPILDQSRRVELHGLAPRVDTNCRIAGYVEDTLAFQLIEPKAATPSATPDASVGSSSIPTSSASISTEKASARAAEEEANRKIAAAEVARRAAEESAKRVQADADASKRAAEDADQKSRAYKRQIEEQEKQKDIILISAAGLVVFLGSVSGFLIIRSRRKSTKIARSKTASEAAPMSNAIKSQRTHAARDFVTLEDDIAKVAGAIVSEKRNIETVTKQSELVPEVLNATLIETTTDPDRVIADNIIINTASTSASSDVVDQLAKFAELHAKGTLTEDEFKQIKANLIGQSPQKALSYNDYIRQLRSLRDKGDLTEVEFQSKVLASLSEEKGM